jgi:TonB family protein
MSYRALLFCPDEAAARLVTQVLSELEFTVELSFEPFVTVQKLAAEPFDAVVVDCANEENAGLLFKGARNSTLNHSSLCVAVVEGQMGVAKAFRIGANLVLTKPINIEQSKGTLRVARGLLRKTEPKPLPTREAPATASQSPAPVPNPWVATRLSPTTASTSPAAASVPAAQASSDQPASARTASVPSSLFEAEQDKPATHDPTDVKPRESMPAFLISKPAAVESSTTSAAKSMPEGFTGSAFGAAAAPAMAPERPKSPLTSPHPTDSETQNLRKIKSAAPMATQEAIIPQRPFPEPSPAHVPMFSSYPPRSSQPSGAGTKVLWMFVCLLALGPAGYFGWRKLHLSRYLHRPSATNTEAASGPSQRTVSDFPPANTASATTEPQSVTASVPAPDATSSSSTSIATNTAPEGFPTKESIEVGQPLDTPEPEVTVVPKPEPLRVKQNPTAAEPATPAPPSLVLAESKAADSAVAGIVSANVAVPKPSPGSLQISEGVTQGLLVKKIAPVYPSAALHLRKQGSVELLATVSKTGEITNVKVLRGESMLTQAAVDAVRQWKYRPFLLNSEPVEIQTQITINFKLPK